MMEMHRKIEKEDEKFRSLTMEERLNIRERENDQLLGRITSLRDHMSKMRINYYKELHQLREMVCFFKSKSFLESQKSCPWRSS
jgi:hypothetical protein